MLAVSLTGPDSAHYDQRYAMYHVDNTTKTVTVTLQEAEVYNIVAIYIMLSCIMIKNSNSINNNYRNIDDDIKK